MTNFAVVRGPSLKGAVRQAALEAGLNGGEIVALFGPDTREAPEHAGPEVGDARLLLFPMRSLKGTFAWTTCPFALRRLKRDLDDAGLSLRVGQSPAAIPKIRTDSREVCVASTDSWVAINKPATAGPRAAGVQSR